MVWETFKFVNVLFVGFLWIFSACRHFLVLPALSNTPFLFKHTCRLLPWQYYWPYLVLRVFRKRFLCSELFQFLFVIQKFKKAFNNILKWGFRENSNYLLQFGMLLDIAMQVIKFLLKNMQNNLINLMEFQNKQEAFKMSSSIFGQIVYRFST